MEPINQYTTSTSRWVARAESLLQKNGILFSVFFLLTFIVYYRTNGAGFTYDFINIAHLYDGIGFRGLPQYFSLNGYLPFYHVVMFTFYKLFWLHGLPWHVVVSLIHAANAFLLFKIVRKTVHATGNIHHLAIAFCASLLFLLNPFQAESVIWQAAIHYPICALLMLACLWAVIQYAETQKTWLLFLIPVLQLVAHFTLEESLVIPIFSALFIWLAPPALFQKVQRKKLFLQIFLPQLFMVVIYFAVHYAATGALYSHNKGNGDLDPLNSFHITRIASNYIKFLLKFFVFIPYLDFSTYTHTFDWVDKPLVATVALILMGSVFVFAGYKYRNFSNTAKVGFLFFLFYSVALAPVINFPHEYYFPCQNERYGYFASMFLFPMLVILVFQLLPRFKYVPIVLFLGVSLFCLKKTIGYWHGAREVRDGLVADFRWYDKEHIYIVGIPESFRGAWMFQDPAEGHMFAKYIEVYKHRDIKNKTKDVVQFVMNDMHDFVNLEVKSDSELVIHSACDGTWLTRIKGSNPDADPYYKTVGGGSECHFIRKVKQPNSVYIYSNGDKWKEVAF